VKPTESQRLALRTSLVEVIGESNATVLMEAMPPIDYDNLATRQDLALTAAALTNKIDAMRNDVDARFGQVDGRLGQVDARFDQIDARFEQVDARFSRIDARFDQIDARFEQVDARFVAITAELRGEMAELRGGLRSEMASMARLLVATQVASMVGVVGLVLGFG
jgi:uncharacterized phage infection (PIP) family protein YhgE